MMKLTHIPKEFKLKKNLNLFINFAIFVDDRGFN